MWQVHCLLIMKDHCEFQRPTFCDKIKKLVYISVPADLQVSLLNPARLLLLFTAWFLAPCSQSYTSQTLCFPSFLTFSQLLRLLLSPLEIFAICKETFLPYCTSTGSNVFFSELYLASTTLFLILILFSINKLICRILI